MKLRLIAILAFASALPLLAQQTGGDQDLELVRPPTGGTFIQWEAKAGRTYFIQVSNPAAPLQKWAFAPVIEVGVGQTISYEVPSTADKGFFRLKYTDIPIPSGVSPEDADPDGDGLSNAAELTGTGTDPLDADTDHDSLPDGWEAEHGLDPNDDGSGNVDNGAEGDPDHDGVPNGDEWDAGTDPSNADSDSDGITDGGELDQGTDPNDPVDKPEAEWFVLTGTSPMGVAKSRSRTVTIPKGESRLVVVMLASEEYPGYTGTSSNFNDVLTWNIAGSGLAMNGTVDVNSRHAAWETDAQNGISCLGFSPAHLEEYHSVQAPPDADLDVTIALTATNVSDWRYPSTVMVGLLPIRFEITHTENERDGEGNEVASIVDPGEDVLLRDEIADLRIELPSLDKTDWDLTIDLEPDGMKMATLGDRGQVQMYDVGKIDEETVVPLTATANGATVEGPYDITLSGDETVIDTFRVVSNRDGAFRLRIKTADDKVNVTSQEFTVNKRARIYGIPYASFPNHDPNRYDGQFSAAAAFWGEHYQHALDDVDRLKAMSVMEGNVGAAPSRPNDILSIGNTQDPGLRTIRGTEGSRQYDPDLQNRNACDQLYKWMNYPDAGYASTAEAIKWGTLWLYQFAWTRVNNPAYTWENRNLAPLTELLPTEEPEMVLGVWKAWDTATDEYNGEPPNEGDPLYMTKFDHSFRQGLHYENGNTTPIWPILTTGAARPNPQP